MKTNFKRKIKKEIDQIVKEFIKNDNRFTLKDYVKYYNEILEVYYNGMPYNKEKRREDMKYVYLQYRSQDIFPLQNIIFSFH